MITRLFEIVIAVNDFDAGVKKFSGVLGAQPRFLKEEHIPMPGLNAATFHVGDVTISISASRQPDTPVARFLQTRGEGVYLVGLEVTDIEQDMRKLAEKGVEFASEKPIPYRYGKQSFARPKSMYGVPVFLAEHDVGYYGRFLQDTNTGAE